MQTLAELQDSFEIYAVCEPCQRVEALPLQQLIQSEGPDYPISRLRLRLCCRQCGQRSQALRIVYVGRNRRTAEFHYTR